MVIFINISILLSIMDKILSKFLSKNEVIIYQDILKNGTSRVTNIAKRTNLARNKIYDAIYRMESKKLVVSEPGKIKQYSLLNPAQIKAIVNETLQKQKLLSNEVESIFPEIKSLFLGKQDASTYIYLH